MGNELLDEPREVGADEILAVMECLHSGQRFKLSIVVGLFSSVLGIMIWANFLNWIGWIDYWLLHSWSCIIVVGLATLSIRYFGRGVDDLFSVLGILFGFLIPFFGEFYAILLISMNQNGLELVELVGYLSWSEIFEFIISRSFWDWALFLVGAVVGAAVSHHNVTEDEVRGALQWRQQPDIKATAASFIQVI